MVQVSGDEVLYVRPDAVFDKSKPISGGIPHCFPQVIAPSPPGSCTVCWQARSFLCTLRYLSNKHSKLL